MTKKKSKKKAKKAAKAGARKAKRVAPNVSGTVELGNEHPPTVHSTGVGTDDDGA